MSPKRLTLNLLGVPSVDAEDGPFALSPSAITLLAYLAIAPHERRSRALVASHLFSDCPESTARKRLNTALWRLRAELRPRIGVDPVDTDRSYAVSLSSSVEFAIDARLFTAMLTQVLRKPPHTLTVDDAATLEHAITLHHGTLVEPCSEEWVFAERHRIENLYLNALDYLVQFYGTARKLEDAQRCGMLALELEPLREDIHRHLMQAFARTERLDLVERQYEQCRAVLLDELGADPLPETTALYSRLTRSTGGQEKGAPSESVASLIHELEQAKREVGRLESIVDRALDHLHRLS